MRKKKLAALLLALALLTLSGCGVEQTASPSPDASGKLIVSTTFDAPAEFARAVGGDKAVVSTIIPDGTEPHDALHERQGKYKPYQPLADLQELRPRWNFDVVPPVEELIHGITAVRNLFSQMWFDESQCKDGLNHLALYRKRFVRTTQTYADEPVKFDGHSEAADALRQFAQVFDNLNPTVRAGQRPRRRRGALS